MSRIRLPCGRAVEPTVRCPRARRGMRKSSLAAGLCPIGRLLWLTGLRPSGCAARRLRAGSPTTAAGRTAARALRGCVSLGWHHAVATARVARQNITSVSDSVTLTRLSRLKPLGEKEEYIPTSHWIACQCASTPQHNTVHPIEVYHITSRFSKTLRGALHCIILPKKTLHVTMVLHHIAERHMFLQYMAACVTRLHRVAGFAISLHCVATPFVARGAMSVEASVRPFD